jgi:hypothetical protein
MDKHALAVQFGGGQVMGLTAGTQGGSYKAPTAKLLSCFIDASRAYPESPLVTHNAFLGQG